MKPPLSNEFILLDLAALSEPSLPSYIPLEIIVQVYGKDVPQNIFDECASVTIVSSISWLDLGSPHLASVTWNMLIFNIRDIKPLWILP
jgi:hypothetical protein